MSRIRQFAQIAEISAMRRRQAARRLETASALERQRADMAQQARVAHAHASEEADNYVARRFTEMDQETGASGFLTSLALGHRQAMREAVAMATRADRLGARHQEAVKARAALARELLQAEQIVSQRENLADEARADDSAAADAAEEENTQDIFAGGMGA